MILPIQFARLYGPLLPELDQAFHAFIEEGSYILGPPVERFEEDVRRYLGARHAVGCKSGSHALVIALLAAGVGPGAEVITVANTYYATAQAIREVGATPVFCDVDPETGLMDPAGLAALHRPATRAVLPVHLYGREAPMAPIRAFCAERGLALVEDCAHAFGTRVDGRYVGADSDFACFSFYPTKNLGALGDAGMVLTRDPEVAADLRRLRYYADSSRTTFHADAEHARLDSLQASLLSFFLTKIDDWLAVRRRHSQTFRTILGRVPQLRLVPEDPRQEEATYSFPAFSPRRQELLADLRDCGIHLQVHYSTNLHTLPQFAGGAPPRLPHTERHNAEVFNLSPHPSLTDAEVDTMATAVAEFFERSAT